MRLSIKILFVFVLVTTTAAAAFGQKFRSNAAVSEQRYVHEIDIPKLLKRCLTPEGHLDPKFTEAVTKPSKYYSDLFGIQALANTTKEAIKRDFVPKYAEVAEEDANQIKLKFKNGWTGTFYPHSLLSALNTEVPLDHVYISGDTWPEMLKNLGEFLDILKSNRLEKRYLIPNPHYKEELVAYKKFNENSEPAEITLDPDLSLIQKTSNAVFLAPEWVHGSLEGYQKFNDGVLAKQKFDWIVMEMFTRDQQKTLDAFVSADESSESYKKARKALIEFFQVSFWNRTTPRVTNGEDNYYFKIVDLMRKNKTRIIAAEVPDFGPYNFFRYGETPFGIAVRDYFWAETVPHSGRGVVFGGSAHFSINKSSNVQDFIKLLNPNTKLFIRDSEILKKRK